MRNFPTHFKEIEEVVKKFDGLYYSTTYRANAVIELPEGMQWVASLPHFENMTGFEKGPQGLILVECPFNPPNEIKIKYLTDSFDRKTLVETFKNETFDSLGFLKTAYFVESNK